MFVSKQYIKDLFRATSLVILSILIGVGTLVVFAITWPGTSPGTQGGNFMNYFNAILVNTGSTTDGKVKNADKFDGKDSSLFLKAGTDCGAGKAIQGLSSTGAKICAEVPDPAKGDVLYAQKVYFTDNVVDSRAGNYAQHNGWIDTFADYKIERGERTESWATSIKKICKIGTSDEDRVGGKFLHKDINNSYRDDEYISNINPKGSRSCASIICNEYNRRNTSFNGTLVMSDFAGNCTEKNPKSDTQCG